MTEAVQAGERLVWTVCEDPPQNVRLIRNPGIEKSFGNRPGHVMRVYHNGRELYVRITNESPPSPSLRGIQVNGVDYRPPRNRQDDDGLPPSKSNWYWITVLEDGSDA
ncbi:MAG TPA: hypothetical protein VNA25_30655 [Phycisphaerae bacterium]|nr:hypothetical protein [Phycisphaerae bacterium]